MPENYEEIVSNLLKKTSAPGLTESINDLKDKEFSGIPLTEEEKKAIHNFEQFRLKALNSISEEEKFHLVYRKFQVLANLCPWTNFL